MVGLRNFELFSVNRILHFEVNFVLEIFRKTQVVLVDAERILMFAQDIQIAFMNLELGTWNLELGGGISILFLPWIIFSSSLLESGCVYLGKLMI